MLDKNIPAAFGTFTSPALGAEPIQCTKADGTIVKFAGYLDKVDKDFMAEGSISTEYMLECAVTNKANLSRGGSIMVGGLSYTIKEDPYLIDDGAIIHVKIEANV